MKKHSFKAILLVSCSFLIFPAVIFANNIAVTNVTLTGQNTNSQTTQVQFNIAWANSWRIGTAPANWDAAWVFVKYRINGAGPWLHASINNNGYVAPSGSAITVGFLNPDQSFNAVTNAGMGVFIYRSTDGSGTFSLSGVQLQWNYGVNSVANNDVVDIQVYAIEMVYIPQANFAAGDGLSDANQFTVTTINTADVTKPPSGTGTLGGQAGGYPTGQIAPANDSWPNGFNAFYCMKYEISQQGYIDFLNSLNRTQQTSRVQTDISSGITSITNRYVMSMKTFAAYRNGVSCDDNIPLSGPVTFYADFHTDGKGGQPDDGQDIACNYLSWSDVTAYLHWAGLRPMSELEFEKCGRGNQLPVAGDYAWGSTITDVTKIINSGKSTEIPDKGANAIFGLNSGDWGPLRVGCFAGAATNRSESGAGYYGNMELSGNVEERTVTIGNADGRAFMGSHGNGQLDADGNSTNTDWPSPVTESGAGLRGGCALFSAATLRVSDRSSAALNFANQRVPFAGGRGCRTAP